MTGPTWLHDDVLRCSPATRPRCPSTTCSPTHPWERTASWTYVRFHGPHALTHRYGGRYTGRRLRSVAERLATWRDEGTDVYGYFNNDFDGHAVTDALWLRDRLNEMVSTSNEPFGVNGSDPHGV